MRARGGHQLRLTRFPFPVSMLDIYFAPGSRGILIGSLCLYYLFMEAVIITSILVHISITFPLPFHCSMSSVHKELIGNSFLYPTIPHTTYRIPHSIFLEPHFALSITWLSWTLPIENPWHGVVYGVWCMVYRVRVYCALSFNGISSDLWPAGWQITMWTIHETAHRRLKYLIMHKGLHGDQFVDNLYKYICRLRTLLMVK